MYDFLEAKRGLECENYEMNWTEVRQLERRHFEIHSN